MKAERREQLKDLQDRMAEKADRLLDTAFERLPAPSARWALDRSKQLRDGQARAERLLARMEETN